MPLVSARGLCPCGVLDLQAQVRWYQIIIQLFFIMIELVNTFSCFLVFLFSFLLGAPAHACETVLHAGITDIIADTSITLMSVTAAEGLIAF